jgi:hypothetical protein
MDAIKDCSRGGAIVLDSFGGSGTTMVAAQKSGRLARLIEYDPAYCNVILLGSKQQRARPPFWHGPGRHLRTSRPRAPSPKLHNIQAVLQRSSPEWKHND